jgi:hypothetical protein
MLKAALNLLIQKYIHTDNIERFKRYMSTRGNVPFHTLKECMWTAGGSKRSILSLSKKFEKVHEGVQSYGLYLAPSTMVQGVNTCHGAGECKGGCIAFANNLATIQSQTKQYMFTVALYHHTVEFLVEVVRAIIDMCQKHVWTGEDVMIRLNSTSDLPFYMVLNFEALCNDIQNLKGFYDYTKIPNRYKYQSPVYHLTYSWSERSTLKTVSRFDRVSIVVSKRDQKKLLKLYPGVFQDGDLHDLRALDTHKFILLGVKKVGGFQQMNQRRKVSETFIQSYDDVVSMFVGGEV